MKKRTILFYLPLLLILSSCAELVQIANSIETEQPLTESQIASGLKEALRVGTDTATARLAKKNGYFGDELVKILLPPEADIIVDNAGKIPGGEKLINDVILSINRAAEDAASEAGPVFFNAITQLTITDAVNILKGDNNAATNYFKSKTYNNLFQLYNPKIKKSINKKIAGNISANDAWNSLVGKYNKLATSFAGKLANLQPVNTKLDQYLTSKALDGLFLKIADEESKIRTNPVARVTDILKKVFG